MTKTTNAEITGSRVTDRYLSGNYAPVTDEVTLADVEVEGAIPAALHGTYLRTGPNPIAATPGAYHWFLGDGMVHGFTLADGRASYRNRWVRTAPVAEHFGQPPVDGPPQPMYDASNTNVLGFGGRILSLTEGAYPHELSPELDTLRRVGFDGVLPHGMTAHPKIDPITGELHAFSYWWDAPTLIYHSVDRTGRLRSTEPITLPAPVSMHDFAFTERNIVFFDQPAVFDLDRAAAGTFPYSWQPDNGARVGLLPRGGTDADVRWFDTEIGYSFHPMNAHEREDGTIVVILPLTASAFTDEYALDIDAGEGSGFQRWTIDPVAGVVEQETLDATPQDFCRIDERLLGSPNRYGYTMALGQPDLYGETRVFKHDFVAGTREEHDFGPGRHPGEVVFVVDPARAEHEDGGWLLGLVHDDAVERTSMVILDAQRIGEDPVASVHLPRRVPYGFHGNWVPA